MKKTLKSIGAVLAAIIFLLVVGIGWYGDLIDPYTWHKGILEQWEAAGWKVVSTREAPSLIFPWTLIWRPLGMIEFVHPDMVRNLYRTDGKPGVIVSTVVARFTRDDSDRVDARRHAELFDCSKSQYATIGDLETKERFDVLAADGSPLPGKWYPMNPDLFAYFCKDTGKLRSF